MCKWDYLLVGSILKAIQNGHILGAWGYYPPDSGLTLIRARNGRLLGQKRLSIVLIKLIKNTQILGIRASFTLPPSPLENAFYIVEHLVQSNKTTLVKVFSLVKDLWVILQEGEL